MTTYPAKKPSKKKKPHGLMPKRGLGLTSKPRKPLKGVNRARRKKNHVRAYGPAERIEFVKSLPCIALGKACMGAIENAHIVTGGMGRKADADKTVPACWWHHQRMHVGIEKFERNYGLDLKHEAELTEEKWQAHKQEMAA